MKVKNLMFSGFAAAMFAGVMGSADAATYNLASKNYVDTEVAKRQAKLTPGDGITITTADDGTTTIDTKPIQVDGQDKPIDEVVQGVTDVIGDTAALPEGETVIGNLTNFENAIGDTTALPEGETVIGNLTNVENAIGDTSRLPEDASIIDVIDDVQLTIGEITNEAGEVSTVQNVLAEKENVSNKLVAATAEEIEGMNAEEKATKYPSIAVAQTIANAAVTKVNEVAGDLSTLQTQVGTNTADIATLKSADTELGGRVDTLETNVGDTPVSDQIDAKITALDLPNTYDAKGAAAGVQTAVTEAKYVSAKDATAQGGYLVKVDDLGNVSMLEVAIVNGDGTKDMITDTALNVTVD